MQKQNILKMIKQEREKLAYSGYTAARKAGINQSTWHRVERNEIDASWEMLFAMATAVGLAVNISVVKIE